MWINKKISNRDLSLPVFIYGVGGHAELVAQYLLDAGENLGGFVIEEKYFKNKMILERPVLTFEQFKVNYSPEEANLFIALGSQELRISYYIIFKELGYSFINIMHPSAIVPTGTSLGDNIFIDPDCVLHPFVSIGSNTILIGAKIGHHSQIAENCFISGSILGGNVILEENVVLSLSCTIKNKVKLRANTFLAMGLSLIHI